jgi:hypothetical protein
MCLLDLSAASNTIDHSGITGTALPWIQSYVNCRPFKVNINNFVSFLMNVLFGVPKDCSGLFTLFFTVLL